MDPPYKKLNDELKYISVFSNHPFQILKQLTTTISQRLSKNEDALSKSDFKSETTYKDSPAPSNRKMINRKKNYLVQPSVQPKCVSNYRPNIDKIGSQTFPTHLSIVKDIL